MSHCGSESRGGIFPSLQQGFTSDLLSIQVFSTLVSVTEKTRGYSEGVTPGMSLHRGVRI